MTTRPTDPKPHQIRRICRKIQASWSPSQELERRRLPCLENEAVLITGHQPLFRNKAQMLVGVNHE